MALTKLDILFPDNKIRRRISTLKNEASGLKMQLQSLNKVRMQWMKCTSMFVITYHSFIFRG